MEGNFRALALAILLVGLMSPAMAISISFGGSGSDGTTSSSFVSLNLDPNAQMNMQSNLNGGMTESSLTASGSGNNRISISSSVDDKSASTEIESSGNFRTSAFAGTSDEGVGISQDTAMSGSNGGMTYHANSPENKMVISSGFEGEGDLKAGISAAAGENAVISGNVNAQGVEMLDSESMQVLASGDIVMSVDGLYSLSNGARGSFGLTASNTNAEVIDRAEAYALTGFRWNTKDPQLRWVLKNNANLAAEGLSASAVQSAITAAANTWDDASTQNLFADSGMVTLNPNVRADSYDRINTVSWKPFASGCSAIGYSRNWYTSSMVGGYKTVKDSDIVFNSVAPWRTASLQVAKTGLDVQSVALHEMGHSLGLGDIYGKSAFVNDPRQVMHYYTGEKRTLGNGDKAGIKKLYG